MGPEAFFRFYIKNKIRREAARQYFWQLLGSNLSCLEARLEAVRKFRFYLKNKIGGELLSNFWLAAWKLRAVQQKLLGSALENSIFFIKNKLETLANTTFKG